MIVEAVLSDKWSKVKAVEVYALQPVLNDLIEKVRLEKGGKSKGKAQSGGNETCLLPSKRCCLTSGRW